MGASPSRQPAQGRQPDSQTARQPDSQTAMDSQITNPVNVPDTVPDTAETTEKKLPQRRNSDAEMGCSPENQKVMLEVLSEIEDMVGEAVETDDDVEYKKMAELA